MIRYFYALFLINVMNCEAIFNAAVIFIKQCRNGGLDYYE